MSYTFQILLLLIFSFVVLNILNSIFSYFAIKLFKVFNVQTFILIGIILGILASVSEIIIGILTSMAEIQEFAIGLYLGVFFALFLLVGGISVIFNKGIETKFFMQNKLLTTLNISIILFIILFSDYILSSTDGILLICAYIYYLYTAINLKTESKITEFSKLTSKKQIYKNIGISLFILVNLVLTGGYVIQNLLAFYQNSHIGLLLIGIAFAAPFFIIPDLLFELLINRNATNRYALSDTFTSALTNIVFASGIIAIISPITITTQNLFAFNLFVLAVSLLVVNIYAYTAKNISKKEGFYMLILYFVILLANILLN